MKIMRYRIRVIGLVLVSSLIFLILWIARSLWMPEDLLPDVSQAPGSSPVSVSPVLSPGEFSTVIPQSTPDTSSSVEPAATPASPEKNTIPEPLYNTFGL